MEGISVYSTSEVGPSHRLALAGEKKKAPPPRDIIPTEARKEAPVREQTRRRIASRLVAVKIGETAAAAHALSPTPTTTTSSVASDLQLPLPGRARTTAAAFVAGSVGVLVQLLLPAEGRVSVE